MRIRQGPDSIGVRLLVLGGGADRIEQRETLLRQPVIPEMRPDAGHDDHQLLRRIYIDELAIDAFGGESTIVAL